MVQILCSIGVLHNNSINEQIVHYGGNGIFVPKNTNFFPEETVLQNSAAEFDGDNLVYDFVMPHSNNREHVVTELETHIQGKVVKVAKIIILYCLIPNASTHPYLQVLWQSQFSKLNYDVVIICLSLSAVHPQMTVAKPP